MGFYFWSNYRNAVSFSYLFIYLLISCGYIMKPSLYNVTISYAYVGYLLCVKIMVNRLKCIILSIYKSPSCLRI